MKLSRRGIFGLGAAVAIAPLANAAPLAELPKPQPIGWRLIMCNCTSSSHYEGCPGMVQIPIYEVKS